MSPFLLHWDSGSEICTSQRLIAEVNKSLFQYTVSVRRRAIASAVQTLISHLFGDASSPYVIGLISDTLRGTLSERFA